jgi:hypothetical protein
MSKETAISIVGMGITLIWSIILTVVKPMPMIYIILGYMLGGGLIVYGVVGYIFFGEKFVEFLNQWNVRRISDDKIRIDGEIMITAPKTSVKCDGTLRMGHEVIKLIEVPLKINEIPQGTSRLVVLDGEYKGVYARQGLLKVRVILGNKKRKCLKKSIPLSIPEKLDKTPNPPRIPRMGFHS